MKSSPLGPAQLGPPHCFQGPDVVCANVRGVQKRVMVVPMMVLRFTMRACNGLDGAKAYLAQVSAYC